MLTLLAVDRKLFRVYDLRWNLSVLSCPQFTTPNTTTPEFSIQENVYGC